MMRDLRKAAHGAINQYKTHAKFTKPLESDIIIYCDDPSTLGQLWVNRLDLADICGVSRVLQLVPVSDSFPPDAFVVGDSDGAHIGVLWFPVELSVCPRCRKATSEQSHELCVRCETILEIES